MDYVELEKLYWNSEIDDKVWVCIKYKRIHLNTIAGILYLLEEAKQDFGHLQDFVWVSWFSHNWYDYIVTEPAEKSELPYLDNIEIKNYADGMMGIEFGLSESVTNNIPSKYRLTKIRPTII